MVVADDYALSRIFSANHVARNRFRHDTDVCERKIFGDDAAPTVGSKLDPRHASDYTRRTQAGNSRIGLANVAIRCLWCFARLQQILQFLLFQPFHKRADVLRALARTDEQSIPCLYHHKIIDANRRDKLSWTRNKISAGVQCMALA